MLVKKAKVFPVECIVRGYLAGSGWAEYQRAGTVCGIPLPAGLVESDRLPEPIFTPSTKAEIGLHDENISFERAAEIIGAEAAEELREKSLAVYSAARDHAASRGIIIADTKFEFGVDRRRRSRSSTRCSRRTRAASGPRTSYRARRRASRASTSSSSATGSTASGWDKNPPAPQLPADVIERTSEMYIQAYELITGRTFVPEG